MVVVQPHGRLVACDAEGYLVNPTDRSLVAPPWEGAVERLIEDCRGRFGPRLDGLYLRGSVPQGTAVEGFSDLDGFALLAGRVTDDDRLWREGWRREFVERHPFLTDLDVALVPLADTRGDAIRCVLKTQTLHVWGTDRRPEFPRYRPGPLAAQHAYRIGEDLGEALVTSHRVAGDRLCSVATWIARRMIRTGFELVMERERAFTRDLYPAWEAFARHYPEHREAMRKILEIAVVGTRDGELLRRLLRSTGPWLAAEAERRFPLAGDGDPVAARAEAKRSEAAGSTDSDGAPSSQRIGSDARLRAAGPLSLRLGVDPAGEPTAYVRLDRRELGLAPAALPLLERLAITDPFRPEEAARWTPAFSAAAVGAFLTALVERGFLRLD